MLVTIGVRVNNTCGFTRFVMLDFKCLWVCSNFQISSCFANRDFIVTSRPFGTPFTTLKAEACLLTRNKIVIVPWINCHAASMNIFIAKLFCTCFKNFEVVVSRQPFPVTCTSDAQFIFSFGVIWIHSFGINRPIQQTCSSHIAIGCKRFPLVLLKT